MQSEFNSFKLGKDWFMENHKRQDNLYINEIAEGNEVKSISKNAVGNAEQEPFCVYNHKRHAVGSKIINDDGSESICKEDGSWQNT